MLCSFLEISNASCKIGQFIYKFTWISHIYAHRKEKIPDEPSTQVVDEAFDVLCGVKSLQQFSDHVQLPPDLRNVEFSQVDTSRWKIR